MIAGAILFFTVLFYFCLGKFCLLWDSNSQYRSCIDCRHPERSEGSRCPRFFVAGAPQNDKNIGILNWTGLILFSFVFPVFAQDGLLANPQLNRGLRDIQGPVAYPANYLLITAIIFLVIAGITFLTFRYLRNKKEPVEQVPVDTRLPWEIAWQQFSALEASSLLEEGDFKVYYSQLSLIIREYFENQFSIKARV